jgi:glyceraldehyde 3-phosphate dehydrogenase
VGIRVAINGFGRIGRALLRAATHDPAVDIVAINDLGDVETLAYLLKYDSVYRQFPGQVSVEGGELVVGAKRIKVTAEKDPAKLPWKELAIDVAVESTGVFDSFEKARAHITSGARKVVITAPVRDAAPNAATVLVGVNEEKLGVCDITSNASCTTNSASPLIAILDEGLGIDKALLNTVHAYTATQSLVDSPAKGDRRRGRAAAQNISPSSTGAAVAVTKAYPNLAGKFDGIAVRVPVSIGSLVDVTFIAKRETTAEEVNKILTDAAATERWKDIFAVSNEPLVSSDIIGNPYASIADLGMTRVIGNLVKVLAWYDNEMGYAYTLLRHIKGAGSK